MMTSGTLSVIGSSMIVSLILRNSRKTPYKRIMLGLSVADIVASLTWIASPLLVPADTSQRIWALGSEGTCNFLGFMTQLSFIAIWYNGMLSYYYLLTIRFKVRSKVFQQWLEPWLHFLCISYSLSGAIYGSVKEIYGEINLGIGCYISEYPKNCTRDGNCEGFKIGWIIAGAPTIVMFASILVNNFLIYSYVKQTTALATNKTIAGHTNQMKRIQDIATQASLYVGSFMITYCWAFALRVAESADVQADDEASLFPVLVLQSMFLPLQGVWNLFVYTRPSYLRNRRDYPNESRMYALKRAWFGGGFKSIHSLMAGIPTQVGVYLTEGLPPNISESRLRASHLFTATFSGKGPLRGELGPHRPGQLAPVPLGQQAKQNAPRILHWMEEMNPATAAAQLQESRPHTIQNLTEDSSPANLVMVDEPSEEFLMRVNVPSIAGSTPTNSIPEEHEGAYAYKEDDVNEDIDDDEFHGAPEQRLDMMNGQERFSSQWKHDDQGMVA